MTADAPPRRRWRRSALLATVIIAAWMGTGYACNALALRQCDRTFGYHCIDADDPTFDRAMVAWMPFLLQTSLRPDPASPARVHVALCTIPFLNRPRLVIDDPNTVLFGEPAFRDAWDRFSAW